MHLDAHVGEYTVVFVGNDAPGHGIVRTNQLVYQCKFCQNRSVVASWCSEKLKFAGRSCFAERCDAWNGNLVDQSFASILLTLYVFWPFRSFYRRKRRCLATNFGKRSTRFWGFLFLRQTSTVLWCLLRKCVIYHRQLQFSWHLARRNRLRVIVVCNRISVCDIYLLKSSNISSVEYVCRM